MRGWKKILLWVAVIGVLLLLGAVLLIRIYVTPERVHDLLQAGLEETFQREVSLGQVDIGLLRGIRLDGLKVATRSGNDELLSAADIELNYDFKALLGGKILFSRVRIKNPKLRLERLEDGSLNISDLFAKEATPSAPAAPSAAPVNGATGKRSLPLLVHKFILEDGSLIFIDRKPRPEAPYLHRLEHLNIDVDDFALTAPFEIQLAAQFNGAPLSAQATLDLNTGLKSLALKADGLGLAPLGPYLQESIPGRLGQGTFSSALRLEFAPNGIEVKGQLGFDGLDFTLDTQPPLQWRNMYIAFDQDLTYRFSDKVLEVRMLTLDSGPAHLAYQGKVALAAPLSLAGEGQLTLKDLRSIGPLLPANIETSLTSFGLAGKLESSFVLAGEAQGAQVVRSGKIQLSDLQASIGPVRPAVSGQLDYADQTLTGKQLGLHFKEQTLLVDLTLAQLLAARPQLRARVGGELLDLDSLLPPTEKDEATAAPSAAPQPRQTKEATAAPPTATEQVSVLPLGGTVEVALGKVIYRGLSLTGVNAQLVLQKDKALLQKLDAELAGGRIALTGEADILGRALPFNGRLKLQQLPLGPVADAFLPEGKGSISGLLDGDMHFAGRAKDVSLSKGLDLLGNFDLRDGEIKGSPLFAGLARFLTNPQFEVLGFSRFAGNCTLKKGQGTIDSRIESRQTFIFPKGNFSLAGPLDLSLETRLSPEVMSRTNIGGKGAELLKDDKGWSLLPLKVKGSYSKPRFSVDSSGLRKQLKKGIVRELGRQLQKKLGNGQSQGGDTQQGKEPAKQLLDDALKKLFGN